MSIGRAKMRDGINAVRLGERFAVFFRPMPTLPDEFSVSYHATKEKAIYAARCYADSVERAAYVVDRLSAEASPRAWRILPSPFNKKTEPVQLRTDEVEALKHRINWSACG